MKSKVKSALKYPWKVCDYVGAAVILFVCIIDRNWAALIGFTLAFVYAAISRWYREKMLFYEKELWEFDEVARRALKQAQISNKQSREWRDLVHKYEVLVGDGERRGKHKKEMVN